jgi:hypothetical protein
MGGFIPYVAGSGGGLGVQPAMRSAGTQVQSAGMGTLGSSSGLVLTRGEIRPLTPISQSTMLSPGGGGMNSIGGLFRRVPSGGGMPRLNRPPVGSYPFRQPPSLLGPATATYSMSM